MRDIEVNWTDKGLELLFDGWPSPRCQRYIRNIQRALCWLSRAGRVLVIGPAQAFGLALVFSMIDGSLRLSADASDNLHRLHLVVDVIPAQHSESPGCPDGKDIVQPTVRCAEQVDVVAKQAGDMLRRLQLLYLIGMWFGIDYLLEERRRKLKPR
jgi:hypothetical protein